MGRRGGDYMGQLGNILPECIGVDLCSRRMINLNFLGESKIKSKKEGERNILQRWLIGPIILHAGPINDRSSI